MAGGAVASWLVRSSPDRAVRVRALAGDIVLCSWARHFTLTVPLSTQEYKWVPANCWGKPNKLLGSDLRLASRPRGVEILLAASCYGNRESSGPMSQLAQKGFTMWYLWVGLGHCEVHQLLHGMIQCHV